MNKDFQMWNIYHNYLTENKISYQEYVLQIHWKNISNLFYKSRGYKYKCEACGSKKQLAIHHKTYIRIGKEWLSDLSLLCKKCHDALHEIYKSEKERFTLYELTDSFIGRNSHQRCKFTKKDGNQCGGMAKRGTSYCGMHSYSNQSIGNFLK